MRELFEVDNERLLFVASTRISAFDVVIKNVSSNQISSLYTPYPGEISVVPIDRSSRLHPITQHAGPAVGNVSVATKKATRAAEIAVIIWDYILQQFPIESMARGYITGIAWAEYSTSKTVNGIPLPAGLEYGQKLPSPLLTPSTKAKIRDKDENITKEQACELVGEKFGKSIEKVSLEIYSIAAKRTEEPGIVLAGTKFEFGTDGETVVLADEALTPDSSRFWVKNTWEQNLGQAQPSLDKQYLRYWLLAKKIPHPQYLFLLRLPTSLVQVQSQTTRPWQAYGIVLPPSQA